MEQGERLTRLLEVSEPSSWLPFIVVASIAGVVLLVLWLLGRRQAKRRAASAKEDKVRGNLEGQILSMLSQAGGSLTQSQIRGNLDLPVAEVAQALRQLEEKGLVAREWNTDAYTFVVHAKEGAVQGDKGEKCR